MHDVTPAELSVLELLWTAEPRTVKDLAEALYPVADATAQATVQKLLERLRSKGFVTREKVGRAFQFRPGSGREELIGRRLKALADQLCGGSLTPLLTHLVAAEGLRPEERLELSKLLTELSDPEEGDVS